MFRVWLFFEPDLTVIGTQPLSLKALKRAIKTLPLRPNEYIIYEA